MLHRPRAHFLTVVLVSLLAGGCGSGEPFDMVKVSGKISYDDGTLLPAEENYVRLTFISQVDPLDSRTHPRPATAEVDLADGTFDCATTHHWGDGLIVGAHKVVISTDVRQVVPKGVPAEYNSQRTTPLEIDTADAPFDLKIRKPQP